MNHLRRLRQRGLGRCEPGVFTAAFYVHHEVSKHHMTKSRNTTSNVVTNHGANLEMIIA